MEEFFKNTPPPPPAQVRLGRWLFYDTRLSADRTISCATCHQPDAAFSNRSAVADGVHGQRGTRKVPALINLAVLPPFPIDNPRPALFWDGRATSLEGQAVGPMINAREMGMSSAQVVSVVAGIRGYRRYFTEAFGTPAVTIARIASAIAAYERTRMSGNSPADRFEFRRDLRALSPAAQHGRDLFDFKAHCSTCHNGSNFTDGAFDNLGVGWDPQRQRFTDDGRGAVTQRGPHGAFKTPTLREVARHPPYMHDGSLATLRDVVEFYNRGGNPNPGQTGRITKLHLKDAEIDALVEYLRALSGEGFEDRPPALFPQ